jgi:hypothetical protein
MGGVLPEAFTGRGQGGPCLTDAAQEAAPGVAVRQPTATPQPERCRGDHRGYGNPGASHLRVGFRVRRSARTFILVTVAASVNGVASSLPPTNNMTPRAGGSSYRASAVPSQHAPWKRLRVLCIFHHNRAVDHDGGAAARGKLMRLRVGRTIIEIGGIKDR